MYKGERLEKMIRGKDVCLLQGLPLAGRQEDRGRSGRKRGPGQESGSVRQGGISPWNKGTPTSQEVS